VRRLEHCGRYLLLQSIAGDTKICPANIPANGNYPGNAYGASVKHVLWQFACVSQRLAGGNYGAGLRLL